MRSHFRIALPIVAMAATALAIGFSYPGVKPVPVPMKAGFDSITEARAKQVLGVLCSPGMEGRGTGQPGYLKAADYVAGEFKRLGLRPGGDNGTYFQAVPFTASDADPSASYLSIGDRRIPLGTGFGVTGVGEETKVTGPLTVVHMGESAEANSLPEDQIKGSIIILDGPGVKNSVVTEAFRKGALSVLQVSNRITAYPSVSYGHNVAARRRGALRGYVTPATVEKLLNWAGAPQGGFEVSSKAAVHKTQGVITMNVKGRTRNIGIPNVVGILDGADAQKKHEWIGVGSHLDHLGVSNGVVYPGADDDGSGSTALILLAEGLTKNPVKPARSVVFMAFTGEEMGLLGSKYCSENPPMPLKDMACLLQMDMVGRNEQQGSERAEENVDTIHLVGSKRISTTLHNTTLAMNDHTGFKFEYDEEGVYTRSDHAMFARFGVPITFLFSGFHPDYHQPGDTIDKINWTKLISAARLNYLVVHQVAAMPALLARDAKPEKPIEPQPGKKADHDHDHKHGGR